MFKSKTDFNAFDKNNKKVENVDPKKSKSLSKAGTKKLLTNLEGKAPFFLILNYFQDAAGKPLGHFLDFGVNKKLAKHFEQVEMKSGKLDKSMSASQKEAAMGEVYAKEENGKTKLYFEPDANCKIPKGKWPKILKEIRPLINSLKAVVILNGEAIEEESGEENTNTEETTSTENTAPTGAALAELKALLKPITTMLKTTLRAEIVPRIKAKSATEADREAIATLQTQISEFMAAYASSDAGTQTALAKAKLAIEGQEGVIKKVAKALEGVTSSGTSTGTTTSESEQPMSESYDEMQQMLEELLERTELGLKYFDDVYQDYQKEGQPTPAPMPAGDSFLGGLGL